MTEWKMHTMEKAEKSHPGKRKKNHHWKMQEWKIHTLEIDRTDSAHHGIC